MSRLMVHYYFKDADSFSGTNPIISDIVTAAPCLDRAFNGSCAE